MIDRLQYISQPSAEGSHLASIRKALGADCRWIQLRIKDEPAERILPQALQAAELCRQFGARLIINDHPDIAVKVNAYGLHLGLDDMPVPEARKLTGKQLVIGGTANTLRDIEQRVAEGVDYIGLGPFRFTTTKKKLSPILGIEGYTRIMEQVRQRGIQVPVIAIGGIEAADIPAIMTTGIYGVALSGAITRSTNGQVLVKEIVQSLGKPLHSSINH